MKLFKSFFITLLISTCLNANSQSFPWHNLIPNYSFETIDLNDWLNSGLINLTFDLEDGRYDNNTCDTCFSSLNSFEKIEQYWSYTNNWTVPERRYPWCGVGIASEDPIGTPDVTYAPLTGNDGTLSTFSRAYSGQLWTYTHNLEFAVVEPNPQLQSGHYYYVEAFAKSNTDGLSVANGSIELYGDKPKTCATNKYITEYSSNNDFQTILNVNHPYLGPDQLGWVRYRNFFSADNDKNWLSIGSSGPGGMEWDDLRIYEVDQNLCRGEWYFDNTVFNYPVEIFQAGNFIKAGTGVDPESTHLPGPVKVLNTSHTIFRAGNAIYLEPGFEVDSLNGAIFEAIIEPCQPLCPPINVENLVFNCVTNNMNIGINDLSGTFADMSWSSSQFLDDSTSTNPVFLHPGGSGTIIYNVFYHQVCPNSDILPDFAFFTVTVNYWDGNTSPPMIDVLNLQYDEYSLTCDFNVNSATDVIQIKILNPDASIFGIIEWERGIDFTGNIIPFDLSGAPWGVCKNFTFEVTAKNRCANLSDVESFTWVRNSNPIITAWGLPQNVTFLSPSDLGTDLICFSSTGASHYDFALDDYDDILIFSEFGVNITSDNTCTGFKGYKNNGDALVPFESGYYESYLTLYNDCGGIKDDYGQGINFFIVQGIVFNEDPNGDLSYELVESNTEAHESGIYVQNIPDGIEVYSTAGKISFVQLYSISGSLILEKKITGYEKFNLSSGIYILNVTNHNGNVLREKVVITN